jgi:ABC-type cobalamin/Fe3+-siderophores transport system ATPase subunit
MDIHASTYQLANLTRINVILGKNGCGKSTLLKAVESNLVTAGARRYITPERGGVLSYEPNVELNLNNNLQWLGNSRRRNQAEQFRQQSVAQFRRFELAALRTSEQRKEVANFEPYIERLNSLLDNIELRRVDPSFKLFSKATGDEVEPGDISSGEAELISLGIEAFAFAEELDIEQENYLFLDEPDVHLHPDLQGRLVKFLIDLVEEKQFTILIATHSTAILGGLANYDDASIAFMQSREQTLSFEKLEQFISVCYQCLERIRCQASSMKSPF